MAYNNYGGNKYNKNFKKSSFSYKFCSDEGFVNPYNFVPVGKDKKSYVQSENEKLHTGVLECRLITKTPLVIPDVMTEKVSDRIPEHKQYDFFRYDEKFVIPGSSIRGVLRSAYETATDSCFSTTKEEQIVTMRDESVYKPGMLIRDKEGKWDLYKAERQALFVRDYKKNDYEKEPNNCKKVTISELKKLGFGRRLYVPKKNGGRRVKEYITQEDYSKMPPAAQREYKEGYLFIGERFIKKRNESIFTLDSNEAIKKDVNIEVLDIIYDTYNNAAINKQKKGEFYKGYKEARDNGYIPAWYTEEKGNIKLSLASIGRKAYDNRMGNIVGAKRPCRNRKDMCKACQLFGMVGNEESAGSKVRITDAICVSKNPMSEYKTLGELSTPRISYLLFYTNGASYDDPSCEIKGRKYYWHDMRKSDLSKIVSVNKGKMNATYEALDSNNVFEFRVYYDGISKKQLDELIWSLTLSENKENSEYCHKIGHGKPFGLGSVKIVIDKQIERNIMKGQYALDECADIEEVKTIDGDKDIIESLLKIANINSMKGLDVRYPYVDYNSADEPKANDIAAHRWFSQNKNGGKIGSNSGYRNDAKRLPNINDEDNTLPVLKYIKTDR